MIYLHYLQDAESNDSKKIGLSR